MGDQTKPGSGGARVRRGTRWPWQALRALPLLLALAMAACALPFTVPFGGVSGKTIAAPSAPVPSVAWIADAGHAARAATLQIASDPVVSVVFVLTGRASEGFGGPVMLPTADHLLVFDSQTGAIRWRLDAASLGLPADERHLSGVAVDESYHVAVIVAGPQVLILEAAAGARLATINLPAGVSCVNFLVPLTRPILDASHHALFLCSQMESNGSVQPVGMRVNLRDDAISIVPPPPGPFGPPPLPAAELPLNVLDPSVTWVELDATGTPTGSIYLAGIGAQVVAVRDGVPGTPPAAPPAFVASVLAQRAVVLALAPERFTSGQALPTLPGFLVAPGAYARAFCFEDTPPNTPGTATASTAIAAQSDGTFQVDLRLDVLDDQGHVAHSRHFVVAVATSGEATIQTDTGDADPFKPLPITPCPV
jgi:hypothetical protein